ncbi:FadR/GntR family transcriptional regulator, partial [Selenomonas flueggei]
MKLNLNGVALTDAVAAQIIEYIQEHGLAPGDKLPTEQELVEMFQVSRSTLREAFKTLVSRNILETRQGSGTYVSPKRGIPTDPLGLTFMQTG